MLVVDFIAGPSVGKSSLALGVASALKMSQLNRPLVIEYLPEFAKKLVWQNRGEELKDRFWSSSQQNEELKLLCNPQTGIDIVVFDGSLILDAVYARWTNDPAIQEIDELIKERYKGYPTLTIQVERNTDIPYEETGRFQTFEQSKEIDNIIGHYIEAWDIKPIVAHSSVSEVVRLKEIVLTRFQEGKNVQ